MNASTIEPLVILKGGVSVSLDAMKLAMELEDRGLRFWVDGPSLVVRPGHAITDNDRTRIKANRHGLMTIANYDADAVTL